MPARTVPPRRPLAYHLTWHTYGTWLHGHAQFSVDRRRNEWETPKIFPASNFEARRRDSLVQEPLILSDPQRRVVAGTLHEVADHRAWSLLAANVRTTHVHAVVRGECSPERMLGDFKRWSTRRLREAGLVEPERRVWSEHGSTRYKWNARALQEAIEYVNDRQSSHP